MAQLICIADRFLEPCDDHSIIIRTVGSFFVDSSMPIPALAGREQIDWSTAILAAVEYADRRGIPLVYHLSR